LYHWELLEDPSLHFDFKSQAPLVKKFAQTFTDGEVVRVTTTAGTDIQLRIKGRIGNYCPGFVENAGDLGSPPDIEANVSPIEDASEGVVIIDGSITHPNFGLLDQPVKLTVKKGRITEFESNNKKQVEMLNIMFGPLDSPRRVLAECGVGLNPAAKLTGTMLTDEGAMGCMHFGFGANHTVGGLNKVDFHLDFVFHAATLEVNNQAILREGVSLL
jgi:leucyl aminopeptidase (aminopeptidase T)